MASIEGLTSNEVETRQREGKGNDVKLATSRTYKDIALTNVFNPVNIVLYAIGFGYRVAESIAIGDLPALPLQYLHVKAGRRIQIHHAEIEIKIID